MNACFAHKSPTPEPDDEPIPDHEPEPEEDPVPHPDPVFTARRALPATGATVSKAPRHAHLPLLARQHHC